MYHEKDRKRNAGYLNYKENRNHKNACLFWHRDRNIASQIFSDRNKLNLLTVVAIVGCLPASKALRVITRFPYRSIDGERAKEIASKLIF